MCMMFESLPDEVLMLILGYFGDVYSIFRTFLGLNQRLNRILVDQRLHLFTNFLRLNVRHPEFDHYYHSNVFQEVSQRFVSIKTSISEPQLRQSLQSLIVYHLQEVYVRLGNQFQSSVRSVQWMREHSSQAQIVTVDRQLHKIFNNLRHEPIDMKNIRLSQSLVLDSGARLECDDDYRNEFNLAQAVNTLLLHYLPKTRRMTRQNAYSIGQMFKALIISNPALLNNRDDVGSGGCSIYYFLFFAVYRLQDIHHQTLTVSFNSTCYRTVIELLLLVMQCQQQMFQNCPWPERIIFDILTIVMHPTDATPDEELFVQTSQHEILRLLFDEHLSKLATTDEVSPYTLEQILKTLIRRNRLDIVRLLHRQSPCVQQFFHDTNNTRKIIDLMTGNRSGRRMLRSLIDENEFHGWVTNADFLFILLKKRERRLLQHLFKLFPFLLNCVDEDGNDPLLYMCFKVRGCRHRLIDYLLKIGCNPHPIHIVIE